MTGKPSRPGTFRTGYLAARRCTHSSRSTRETSPRSSCVRTAFKTGGCRTFSRRNPPHSTGLLGSVRAAELLWSFGTSGRQSRRQSARQDDRGDPCRYSPTTSRAWSYVTQRRPAPFAPPPSPDACRAAAERRAPPRRPARPDWTAVMPKNNPHASRTPAAGA